MQLQPFAGLRPGNCSDSGGKKKGLNLREGIEGTRAPGGEEREAGSGIT